MTNTTKTNQLLTQVTKAVKGNTPEILTAFAVTGVVTTAYLTAKASFKAAHALSEENHCMPFKARFKLVWKGYIPPAVAGAVTIGCVIGASKQHANRTAAAVAAYSLTEKAFSEYKEKILETVGKTKELAARDSIAQDRVTNNPVGTSKEVVVVGSGTVLCCEMHTMRYFRSDMETLRQAQNTVNHRAQSQDVQNLNDFYDIVGLRHTSASDNLGWRGTKMLDLLFSTVMSDTGEPCLAFDYNYLEPLWQH